MIRDAKGKPRIFLFTDDDGEPTIMLGGKNQKRAVMLTSSSVELIADDGANIKLCATGEWAGIFVFDSKTQNLRSSMALELKTRVVELALYDQSGDEHVRIAVSRDGTKLVKEGL